MLVIAYVSEDSFFNVIGLYVTVNVHKLPAVSCIRRQQDCLSMCRY
jgi:hypothetical protein